MNDHRKKILITGANGFIGSFLVEEALERNYEVYAGIRKNCDTRYLSDERISFFELDYANPNALKTKLADVPKFDYVIHNAGLTKAAKKSEFSTVNFQYTKNIIEALISENRIPEKFIYMSSLTAFGPADGTEFPEVMLNGIPRPVTSYGRSKLEAENYLTGLSDFPYMIMRPTAVYGPREKDLYTFFKLINRNLEPYIGMQKQDLTFIYVKDLSRAVFHAAESELLNKAYFVSDGNVYNEKTLGGIIKNLLNKKTISVHVPLPLARVVAYLSELSDRISGKPSILNLEKMNELQSVNWKCEILPLQNELSFNANYDLKGGLTETVEWYKKEKWL